MTKKPRARRNTRKGTGLGAALGAFLLVTILVGGVYYYMQTVIKSQQAIERYVYLAQKPVFEISDYNIDEAGNLKLTLFNRGPVEAHVKQILVYKYLGYPYPTGAYQIDLDQYVPVGGTIEITVPQEIVPEILVYGEPLRVLVGTDRGLILVSSPPPQTKAVINVQLPQDVYIYPDSDRTLYLTVDCSGAGGPVYKVPLVPNTPLPYAQVIGDYPSLAVIAEVYGIGKCEAYLEGYLQRPVVGQEHYKLSEDKALLAGVKLETQYINGTEARAYFLLYPGVSTPVVTIKLSDVTLPDWINVSDISASYTQIIDFSWYFMAEPKAAVTVDYYGLLYIDVNVEPYTEPYTENPLDPYQTALTLLEAGAVHAYSPAGCPVSPSPGDSDEVKDIIRRLTQAYDTQLSEVYGIDVGNDLGQEPRHTGLPILIKDYDTWFCQPLDPTILVVTVPITLGEGRYLVVPVFTYNDVDDTTDTGTNDVEERIEVYVATEDGTPASEIQTFTNIYETLQYAHPLHVNSTGGTYHLTIKVTDLGLERGQGISDDAKLIYIILSKIVALRIGDHKSTCGPIPEAS